MREIIFRGKRTDNDEWVYGFYCQFHNRPITNEENSHQIFVAMENAVPFGSMIGGLWYEVIPETVGQYTGRNDMNGKKIFEGDIIRGYLYNTETCSEGSIEDGSLVVWEDVVDEIEVVGEVYYNDGAYNVEEFAIAWFKTNDIEVIGNIHDNPELLKECEM